VHVQIGVDGNLIEVRLIGQAVDHEAVLLRVANQVLDGQQLGNVVPGFRGKRQAGVIGGQTLLNVFLDRARHAAFAAVVGGEGKLPVTEIEVELAEIIQRGVGGGGEIAATVIPGVLLESVMATGRGNELPDARCGSCR